MLKFKLSTTLKIALLHAVLTAAWWSGPLAYGALGLGFKDKVNWNLGDHLVAAAALPIAEGLTTPGRYMTWNGPGGFLIPAFLTSLSWGFLIATFYGICKTRWPLKTKACARLLTGIILLSPILIPLSLWVFSISQSVHASSAMGSEQSVLSAIADSPLAERHLGTIAPAAH